MNHILSSLPLSLQLLTLVALLAAVVLDCVPLLPVIKTSLLEVLSVLDNSEWLRRQIPKAVAWLEKRKWGVRLAAKNCADFGLTPEQVAEIAKSDAPFKPDASSKYTFFGVEGFGDMPRMVLAERDRPEAPVLPPTNPPTEAEPDEQPSALDVLLEGLNQEQGTELLALVTEQGLDANDPLLGLIAIGLRNVEREADFIERMRQRLTEKNKN